MPVRKPCHLVGLECVVVDQNGDEGGGTAGTAVGDDERAIELLESLADLSDQVVEDDGGDHRDGDGEELTPLACAVDGGGLVQVGRHAFRAARNSTMAEPNCQIRRKQMIHSA